MKKEKKNTSPPQASELKINTEDNWELSLYYFSPTKTNALRAIPPCLCIHGFTQNHLTWTAGSFAEILSREGIPTYLLDLRGHGGSIRENQREPYPPDYNYLWDTSSFLYGDLPAAIRTILKRHPEQKPVLCGHSLGGILSLSYALRWPDNVSAVVAIGSPFDAKYIRSTVLELGYLLEQLKKISSPFCEWKTLPIDKIFKLVNLFQFKLPASEKLLLPLFLYLDRREFWPQLWNPELTSSDKIATLLDNAHPETFGVAGDILRWAKTGRLEFGRNLSFDFQKYYHHFDLPFVAVWGAEDPLAPPKTGEKLLQKINSRYVRKLILPKAKHLDLIAGLPVEEITGQIFELYHYLTEKKL